MTGFISLVECIKDMKGSFVGTVITQSDLNSGTAQDGKDWTNKKFTIEDTTSKISLTAWGDDIKKLELHRTYEFVSFYFKTYKEQVQLSFGNYGSATEISTPKQEKLPDADPMKTIPDDTSKPLPQFNPNSLNIVCENTVLLLQIEKYVKETFQEFRPMDVNNGQKVGLYIKIIYDELQKLSSTIKFEKPIPGPGFASIGPDAGIKTSSDSDDSEVEVE